MLETECHGACLISKSSNSFENNCLSSALSIIMGDVPNIFILFLCNGNAKLFGICPDTDTITPLLF